MQRPPFLLIGSDDARAGARAAALYGRIVGDRTPPRFLSIQDAELTKIALNVFLCLKISFGNLLAQFGDRLGGADLDTIANTLALDPRIGSGLLRGGTPYGGPCPASFICRKRSLLTRRWRGRCPTSITHNTT